jgi:CheY-specific phosphatase CheX
MQTVNTDFILPFIESTKSTFEIALQQQVTQKEIYLKKNDVMFGDVSGTVHVDGARQGAVSLSLPGAFAMQCIRDLIGEEADVPLAHSVFEHGIGELLNLICTGAKTKFEVAQINVNLSDAEVVIGRGHKLPRPEGSCTTSIIFTNEAGEEFSLDVCSEAD